MLFWCQKRRVQISWLQSWHHCSTSLQLTTSSHSGNGTFEHWNFFEECWRLNALVYVYATVASDSCASTLFLLSCLFKAIIISHWEEVTCKSIVSSPLCDVVGQRKEEEKSWWQGTFMLLIVMSYQSDLDGLDKVPPGPVALRRISSVSSYLFVFTLQERWEVGGLRI